LRIFPDDGYATILFGLTERHCPTSTCTTKPHFKKCQLTKRLNYGVNFIFNDNGGSSKNTLISIPEADNYDESITPGHMPMTHPSKYMRKFPLVKLHNIEQQ